MDMTTKDYVSWKMSHDIKYGEAEGYPLVLEQCRKNKDLKNLQIYGNSVQDGEPTPENPLEIQSVGELTTKNLIDISAFINSSKTVSGVTLERIGDKIHIYGTPTTTSMIIIPFAKNTSLFLNKGDSVTGSCTGDDYSTVVKSFYAQFGLYYDSNFIVNANTVGKITLSEQINTVSYVSFHINPKDTETYIDFTISIQLEEGSTATEYEPYHKYKIPVRARGKNLFDLGSATRGADNCTDVSYENGVWYGKGKETIPENWNAIWGAGQLSIKFPKINTTNKKVIISMYYTLLEEPSSVGTPCMYCFYAGDSANYARYSEALQSFPPIGERKRLVFSRTLNFDLSIFTMRLGGGRWAVELDTLQIEIGDKVSLYEPYIEPQTFDIYLDEPLRGMYDGNAYRQAYDYIDFNRGEVVRYFLKEVYNGSERWVMSTAYSNTFVKNYFEKVSLFGVCSHYKTTRTVGANNECYLYTSSAPYITDSRFSTVEEFKTFLEEQADAGTPLTIIYCPRDAHNGNPTIETIELPELPKTQAKTMIYEVIDTSIQPSDMYGKYIKKY